MGEKDILPIYLKAYDKICNLDSERIPANVFYKAIENMRVSNGYLLNGLRKSLFKIGLTSRQVDEICNHVSYRVRFNRGDAKEIEKALIDFGLIERKIGWIIVNKDR